MNPAETPSSFKHFSKHLFIISRVYVERDKAVRDVHNHLHRMRKAVIRMSLRYSDVDKLKGKIENLIDLERKYAKFFRPEDEEAKELRNEVYALEEELRQERVEKIKIIDENNDKMMQLTDSLNNIKSKMNHLLMERAKRHQRLAALENKIRQKVDLHGYYHS